MPNIFRDNKPKHRHRPAPIDSWTTRNRDGPQRQYHNPYNVKYDKKSTRSCLDILRGHRQAVKFRALNQSMCEQESTANVSMFASSPELFREYHSGYDYQRAQWKADPLDAIIQAIPAVRESIKRRALSKKAKPNETAVALPIEGADGRLGAPHFTIADLGCGTGKLVEALLPEAGSTEGNEGEFTISSFEHNEKTVQCIHTAEIAVLSFDLVATKPFITEADITALPLPDKSVSLVVLCLSLIGENFVDVLLESYRVLSPTSGRIIIAEVTSRFKSHTARQHFVQLMGRIGFEDVRLEPTLNMAQQVESPEDGPNPFENAFFLYCTAVKRGDLYSCKKQKKSSKATESEQSVQQQMRKKFAKITAKSDEKTVQQRREWHKKYILQKFHPERIMAPYHAKRRVAADKKVEEEFSSAENADAPKQVWKHRKAGHGGKSFASKPVKRKR